MSHYVALFRHSDPQQEDLDRISNAPGVTVLEHSINRAMLLEASDDAIAALRDQLQDWLIAEEVTYPRPGPATHDIREEPDK
jgi:hypothetical protein